MGTRGVVTDRSGVAKTGITCQILKLILINSDDHRDSSEALQLFMRLLTPAEREEVHRLLSFLYIVRGMNGMFVVFY
jgi:hypothetical protein